MNTMQTIFATVVAGAMSIVTPSSAVPVDLELVLLNDVSGNVNSTDFDLQIAGYAAAFRDVALIQKIEDGVIGKIAVSVAFFANSITQSVGWTVIEDIASAEAFAQALEAVIRPSDGSQNNAAGVLPTATGYFKNNGFEGTRNVIDIVTKSAQSTGGCDSLTAICLPLQKARDAALADGVDAINAMVLTDGTLFGPGTRFSVDSIVYAENNIIGGDGSFVIDTPDFNAFAPAIRNMIERDVVVSPIPVPAAGWMLLSALGGFTALHRRRKQSN